MNRYTDSHDFLSRKDLMPQIMRVAAVHDLSCLGRCALTVIIPVLSAMGIQTVPLPTALLSTHTGGFDNMFFEDLTCHMEQISSHWHSIGTDFDAIYSGFLGSAEQIDTLLRFIGNFSQKNDGKKTFVAVDPVMGDDGELYSTYDASLMKGMSRLCYGADLITPNLTEACFLCEEKYPENIPCENEARDFAGYLLQKLTDKFGCRMSVITGVTAKSTDRADIIIIAAKESRETAPFIHSTPHLPRAYPGTGDVFASVLIGKILSGIGFYDATAIASEFVSFATRFSLDFKTPIRDGLIIEPCLYHLICGNKDQHFPER
ncbi:MAG: pyridoxamine kinase [Clostridia bacterium]|nr:pyridoxamine kinase [Clostridia bacterium]